jgi:hypothetical protein
MQIELLIGAEAAVIREGLTSAKRSFVTVLDAEHVMDVLLFATFVQPELFGISIPEIMLL